jgi:superfamily II DNA/RNA helicase
MSFTSLKLDNRLLEAVSNSGYDQATPIQLAAIPALLAGKDVMAGAQTGTGKTAAFALPILHRLLTFREQALVVSALWY